MIAFDVSGGKKAPALIQREGLLLRLKPQVVTAEQLVPPAVLKTRTWPFSVSSM